MSEKVKVRIHLEETLRYTQTVEIDLDLFERIDEALEGGVPYTAEMVRDLLDLRDAHCMDIEVYDFQLVEDEA